MYNLPADVKVITIGEVLVRSLHVLWSIDTVVLPSLDVFVTVIVWINKIIKFQSTSNKCNKVV